MFVGGSNASKYKELQSGPVSRILSSPKASDDHFSGPNGYPSAQCALPAADNETGRLAAQLSLRARRLRGLAGGGVFQP